jgi:hypothetical protein
LSGTLKEVSLPGTTLAWLKREVSLPGTTLLWLKRERLVGHYPAMVTVRGNLIETVVVDDLKTK